MKHKLSSLLLGSVILFSSFTLQNNSIDEVIGALRTGNVAQLSNYFDENVGLTLPDIKDNYSKAQAQLIVKDFFTNNAVKGFELKHKGDGGGGSQYCVGTLQTASGNYRTNVFMKMKNGKEVVKEIRFQSMD